MVSWEGYGRKTEITPISNLVWYTYDIKLFQIIFLGYYSVQSHGFISTFRRELLPPCSEWLGCGAYWKDGRGLCSIMWVRWQGLYTLRATKSFGRLHLPLRSLPFLWLWLAAIAAKRPIKSTVSFPVTIWSYHPEEGGSMFYSNVAKPCNFTQCNNTQDHSLNTIRSKTFRNQYRLIYVIGPHAH
jgi:hypothetical protein